MLKYKYLCQIYHDLFKIICTYFLIIHWISFFDHRNVFVLVFWFIHWISLFDHIFHSFLHCDTMVSDNGIWLFSFFRFFLVVIKNCMNLTDQFLHYLPFNNCNDRFNHIHTSSHTNIIYLCLFHHIPHTNFTVKRQAPKYRSCNKKKKKDGPSTKIPFVSRGGWPQNRWELPGNYTYFYKIW